MGLRALFTMDLREPQLGPKLKLALPSRDLNGYLMCDAPGAVYIAQLGEQPSMALLAPSCPARVATSGPATAATQR